MSSDDLVGGATLRRLELVSQVWQNAEWRHRIDIVVPQNIENDPPQVLLVVAGDAGGDGFLAYAGLIASRIGAPATVLYDVPNQPLLGGLREDALIAESFSRYLEDADEKMPVLLPMVNSAVRAMDVIEQIVQVDLGMHVSGFVVTGGSKRGWTTWLTAAVDDRVSAIAPLAYNNLNMSPQMQHQLDTWGAYSSQVSDYTRRDIPQFLIAGEDSARRLEAMVEPYAYRDGIVVPKLIVTGTNDAYWPLDAGELYLDDLEGETFTLNVPNAGHGLESGIDRVVGGLLSLFLYADGRIDLPTLGWEVLPRTSNRLPLGCGPRHRRPETSEGPTGRQLIWLSTMRPSLTGCRCPASVVWPCSGRPSTRSMAAARSCSRHESAC